MGEIAEQRSRIMRAVKSRDTKPEMIVRRLAHALGFRFRLQLRDLPGRPDLAFPGRRKAIFVHGCFWHGHDCKRGAREPKANTVYWREKVRRNRERDAKSLKALRFNDWQVLVIWECETRDSEDLKRRLRYFLD